MLQAEYTVNVNAMYDWDTGELVGCMMDDFALVDYIGEHIVSCELRFADDDYRVSVMCPKESVRGMSDLNILHQELFAELLSGAYGRCDYMFELEYSEN